MGVNSEENSAISKTIVLYYFIILRYLFASERKKEMQSVLTWHFILPFIVLIYVYNSTGL